MVIRSNPSAQPIPDRKPGVPDFNVITSNALKTYKKIHKLRMKSTNSKSELVVAVTKHFSEMPLPQDEDAVIGNFLAAIKQHRTSSGSVNGDSQSMSGGNSPNLSQGSTNRKARSSSAAKDSAHSK